MAIAKETDRAASYVGRKQFFNHWLTEVYKALPEQDVGGIPDQERRTCLWKDL